MEKLAEMGVIVQPAEESSTKSKKGKGKAKDLPAGHVLFVDDREDCELRGFSEEAAVAAM